MGKPRSGTTTTNVLKGTRSGESLRVSERTDQAWTVDGGAGNDTIFGGSGKDTLLGGSGDDIVFGLALDAKLDGGIGFDTLDASLTQGTVRYVGTFGQLTDWFDDGAHNTATALNFERIIGGSQKDYLFGAHTGQTLVGGGGVDYIQGGQGNDTLVGGYLGLSAYNPLDLQAPLEDDGGDYFQFSHDSGGLDRILDFHVGSDYLFFYGVAQPDLSQIFERGDDVVIPWSNGEIALVGMAPHLDPSTYAVIFTTNNADGLAV